MGLENVNWVQVFITIGGVLIAVYGYMKTKVESKVQVKVDRRVDDEFERETSRSFQENIITLLVNSYLDQNKSMVELFGNKLEQVLKEMENVIDKVEKTNEISEKLHPLIDVMRREHQEHEKHTSKVEGLLRGRFKSLDRATDRTYKEDENPKNK